MARPMESFPFMAARRGSMSRRSPILCRRGAPHNFFRLGGNGVQPVFDTLSRFLDFFRCCIARHIDRLAPDKRSFGEGQVDGEAVPVIEPDARARCGRNRYDGATGEPSQHDNAFACKSRRAGRQVGSQADGNIFAKGAHHGAERASAPLPLLLVRAFLALRHAGPADRTDTQKLHHLGNDLAITMTRDENAHLTPVAPEGRQDHVLTMPCGSNEGLVLAPEACGNISASYFETACAAHQFDEQGDEPGDDFRKSLALQDLFHRASVSARSSAWMTGAAALSSAGSAMNWERESSA